MRLERKAEFEALLDSRLLKTAAEVTIGDVDRPWSLMKTKDQSDSVEAMGRSEQE